MSPDDRRFTEDFAAGRIAPGAFDHRAHIRLAYTFLAEHDTETALTLMRDALLAFIRRNFAAVLAPLLYLLVIARCYPALTQRNGTHTLAAHWFGLLCDNLPGHRDTQMAHYNLGCIDALTGHPEEAMEHLRAAHAVGFTNVEWLQEDGDLTSLRGRPDFAALLALMRNQAPPDAPQAPPKVEPRPGDRR